MTGRISGNRQPPGRECRANVTNARPPWSHQLSPIHWQVTVLTSGTHHSMIEELSMKTVFAFAAAATLLLGTSTESQAATKVVLKDMHICCGKCVKGIENAVKDLDGVKVTVNKDDETATISGESDKAIQKAIDAIADAGYHATSDHKTLKPKDDSGAKEGKVKRLELTGVHNCCGGCNNAVKKAIKTVDGVKADTAKANQESFVVEGDFDALALVKALNKSGFHVKVKK